MNGVLVVDKPEGPTSHDVVSRARRALGTRAVGHAGTLDPMATGVLVLAVGQGTKLVQYLTADDKAYEARILLGITTDTLDRQGDETARADVPVDLDLDAVRKAAAEFLGEHDQRAPVVSAIKQGGRALHERYRRGEEVEAPIRRVSLRGVTVHALEGDEIALSLDCAKGFYVRAFARDLAEKLGTVGHLVALRRTRSGRFGLKDAVNHQMLEERSEGARARLVERMLTLEEAAAAFERIDLLEAGAVDVSHGRPVGVEGLREKVLPQVSEEAILALMGPQGRLLALGRREGELLRVVRGFPRSEETGSDGG